MTKDFILELGTEELPPKDLLKLSNSLAASFAKELNENSITYTAITALASPRRLAIFIENLAVQGTDLSIEKRGPSVSVAYDKNGNPTKATLGFAKSCAVNLEELKTIKTDKGEWLYFKGMQPGVKTEEVLQNILLKAVAQLPIGRKMRWSNNKFEFVRPLRWLMCVFGDNQVNIELFGKTASNITYGHRFHHPQAIVIDQAQNYIDKLRQGFVIVDFIERREIIRKQIIAIAEQQQAQVVWDDELLDETTALVEYPQAVLGKFEEKYLKLPKEALIATMQGHQKYFTLIDKQNNLLPNFITIANIASKNKAQLIQGNENVVRPRLADCEFFFDTDKKRTLASRTKDLQQVVFQKDLGTLADKTARVQKVAAYLADIMQLDKNLVARSVELSKTDLLTLMVQELPELQGIAGKYYAQIDGEPEAVSLALEEQYLPRFAKDNIPSTDMGALLALVQRLDTLVGIFAINKIPTGDKDPFGLRRAAVGMINILINKKINLDLMQLVRIATSEFSFLNIDIEQLTQKVFAYIYDRLRAWYQSENIDIGIYLAVSKLMPTNIVDFDIRVKALSKFVEHAEQSRLDDLIQLNKRVNNILAKQNIDDLANLVFDENQVGLETADIALAKAIKQAQIFMQQNRDYIKQLDYLPNLQQPLNDFFDKVLVMAEDEKLRQNRLALLKDVQQLITKVGDLGELN